MLKSSVSVKPKDQALLNFVQDILKWLNLSRRRMREEAFNLDEHAIINPFDWMDYETFDVYLCNNIMYGKFRIQFKCKLDGFS